MRCQKKKRPAQSTRRAPYDDDPTSAVAANGDAMAVDDTPLPPRVVNDNINFVDDDELQAALAIQRRSKMKARKVLKPEEIARKGPYPAQLLITISQNRPVKEEKDGEANGTDGIIVPKDEPIAEEGEGLVFDDTTEFVRSIVYDGESTKQHVKLNVRKEDLGGDISPSPEPVVLEAGEVDLKEEENEETALHAIQQMDVDANGSVEVKQDQDAEVSASFEEI